MAPQTQPRDQLRSLSLVFNSPSCFSCCQSSPTSVKAPQIVEGLPETPASIPPVIPTPPFTVNTTAKVQPHPSKPSVKVTATANTTAEVNLAPTISSSLISGSSFARKLRQNNKFGWLPYTPTQYWSPLYNRKHGQSLSPYHQEYLNSPSPLQNQILHSTSKKSRR